MSLNSDINLQYKVLNQDDNTSLDWTDASGTSISISVVYPDDASGDIIEYTVKWRATDQAGNSTDADTDTSVSVTFTLKPPLTGHKFDASDYNGSSGLLYDAIDKWMDTINDPDARAASFISDYGHISTWDTGDVTNMEWLFAYRYSFNEDITNWDVSSVTSMAYAFEEAAIFNQDISIWDVSKVNNMEGMLSWMYAFNQDLSTWYVSNVTNMSFIFYASELFNGDIITWDVGGH